MALRSFNYLSLFSGFCGLDRGVELAVPGARCVCGVEREAYACAVLVKRMQEGSLAPFPLWSDVRTFDGNPWRGLVDCIIGGFPCQDISDAGKRTGIKGQRSGLWFEFARIIGEVRPPLVFVENVRALLVRGIDAVLGSLAELGFDAEWCCLSAKAVGAPHIRNRVFIMAYARESGRQQKSRGASCDESANEGREKNAGNISASRFADVADAADSQGRGDGPQRREDRGAIAGRAGEALADATGRIDRPQSEESGLPQRRTDSPGTSRDVGNAAIGRRRKLRQPPDGAGLPDRTDKDLGDAERNGPQGRVRRGRKNDDAEPDSDAGGMPFPPGPGDRERWARIIANAPHLAPAVEPGVRVLADGMAYVVDQYRVDQLRGAGNGVVPLTAALAFRTLWERLIGRGTLETSAPGWLR